MRKEWLKKLSIVFHNAVAMDRYKFLYDFVQTKITCALILNMMNTNHAMSDINPSGLVVSPLSVESELDNLKVAHELGGVAVVNFNKRK